MIDRWTNKMIKDGTVSRNDFAEKVTCKEVIYVLFPFSRGLWIEVTQLVLILAGV
jgi:hypothetical protein